MAAKKKPGRKPNRRPSVAVFARIDPDLYQVLESHVATIRPATTKQAVLQLALEEYLQRRGLIGGSSTSEN